MTAEQLKKSVAASLEELLTVKGTKYDTIDAYGVTVRLGTLSSLDLVEWLGSRRLFILEQPVEEAPCYSVELTAAPQWKAPSDQRTFTISVSMIRLVDASA
jgi:hypothetical protein